MVRWFLDQGAHLDKGNSTAQVPDKESARVETGTPWHLPLEIHTMLSLHEPSEAKSEWTRNSIALDFLLRNERFMGDLPSSRRDACSRKIELTRP